MNGNEAPVTGENPIKVSKSMDPNLVLIFLSLSSNLLSVSQITEALNCNVNLWPNDCVLQDMVKSRIIGCGTRSGRLYYLEEHHQGQAYHTKITKANNSVAWLWHRRLGHLSFSYLRKLKPELFLNVIDSEFKCGIYELEKIKKISYVPSGHKTLVPLQKFIPMFGIQLELPLLVVQCIL